MFSNRCCALELCNASMDRLFLEESDPDKYRGPIPRDIEVLSQIADGLSYLHCQGLAHGNMKPENILISASEGNKPLVVIKWSDFVQRKKFTPSDLSKKDVQGTLKWMAPELLSLLECSRKDELTNGTLAGDVFSAGCLLFYFLRGVHPFGEYGQLATDDTFSSFSVKIHGENVTKSFLDNVHLFNFKYF